MAYMASDTMTRVAMAAQIHPCPHQCPRNPATTPPTSNTARDQ